MATIIDLDYFKKIPNAFSNPSTMIHLFYKMLEQGATRVILSKNDELYRYSADSVKAYLPKLKWRIMNNIYFLEKGDSGFSGREKEQDKIRYKKFFLSHMPFFQSFLLHNRVHWRGAGRILHFYFMFISLYMLLF